MNERKVLLFPFFSENPYFESYAWAVELAHRMKARLQLFTTTTSNQGELSTDVIYSSLLAAHGHYLQHYKRDAAKPDEVLREPVITTGDFWKQLISHLKKFQPDIVVMEKGFTDLYPTSLKELIRVSNASIILSKNDTVSGEKEITQITDRFYDKLRHASLYKLPENFYTTLGNDRSVFNYLRRLIQRRLNS